MDIECSKNSNRLKEVRLENGMKQKEVASILHVSRSVYTRYENGERSVPIEVLWELANYYDLSIDYLVGRVD